MNKNIKYALLTFMLILSCVFAYFVYEITKDYFYINYTFAFLISVFLWTILILLIKSSCFKLAYFISFIISILYVVAFSTFSYYYNLNTTFSHNDIVALSQATIEESIDFIKNYMFSIEVPLISALFAVLVILVTIFLRILIQKRSKTIKLKVLLSVSLSCFSIILFFNLTAVRDYFRTINQIESDLKEFNYIKQDTEHNEMLKAYKDNKGELYILVIGESVNRDLMGVYTNVVDNTPFFTKFYNRNKIVFKNSYSTFINSQDSLFNAFSESNLYNNKDVIQAEDLISVAKKAGFNTYWFSNNVKHSPLSNKIAALSSLADKTFYTEDVSYTNYLSQMPDKVLLKSLKDLEKNLERHENNLIIIHLMGSQSPYDNRYPQTFDNYEITTNDKVGDLVYNDNIYPLFSHTSYLDKYLTSIRYTDDLLADIYNIFRMRIDYQSLVYISTHSESIACKDNKDNVLARHNLATFNYQMAKIPFVVLVSDYYKNKYESTYDAMKENANKVVTLDTLYDFMLNLMQIKSDSIDLKSAISSTNYDVNIDNIYINDYKKLKDEPSLIAFNNLNLSDKFIVNKANSLFKAKLVSSNGYKNLHANALIYDDKIYIKTTEGLSYSILLEDYINSLGKNIKLILDFDNSFNINIVVNYLAPYIHRDKISIITKNIEDAKYLLDYNINSIVKIDNVSLLNSIVNRRDFSVMLSLKDFKSLDSKSTNKFKDVYVVLENSKANDLDLGTKIDKSIDNAYYFIDYNTAYDTNFES